MNTIRFDRLLKKISVEAALNAEMNHHPGYDKNQTNLGTNTRNGYTQKTVITGDGPLELRTPRDRDGSFEPLMVKKNQTRITGMMLPTVQNDPVHDSVVRHEAVCSGQAKPDTFLKDSCSYRTGDIPPFEV